MSTVTVAGSSYSVPADGDSSWGTDVTNLLIQLSTSTKVLQVTSSSFPITQDLSFGTNYGLKVQYLKSQAANPSSTGVIRLGNNEGIGFRKADNTGDYILKVNASDVLEFNGGAITINGTPVQTQVSVSDTSTIDLTLSANDISGIVKAGSLDNSHIAALAAIAYSKLNLTNSILNADINAAAGIQYSKLSLTNSVVDADISASAAIALSKLAALTTGKVLQSNASTGLIEASTVTNTELGYLSGVTSAVQTQLNAKEPTLSAGTSAQYYRGDKTWQTLDKSAVGLDQVDNTSDATKNAAAVVLTNKDVDGGTASNTSRITLPKAAKTTLDGLTRKQGTILYDTTSNKPYYDDGTNLKVIGSGSGGVTNFITNGDAETGTTGWTGYKASTPFSTSDVDTTNDTIQFINHGYVTGTPIVFSTTGTLPSPLVVGTTYYAINNDNNHVKVSATLGGSAIDLTTTGSGTGTLGPLVPLNYGGTPTVTLTTTSTNPLVGTNSFLYTKDAANRAGDGHYYAFTIDSAYKAKVLTIDMEYIIASGTFVAGTSSTNSDVTVWIFDVTNSVWIQPSSYRFYSNSSTISDKFQATFQTSSNSTSYRLYLHTSSASTSAYALEFDNVTVSPSVYTYGTPVTDWQAYTPTITGLGTGSNEGFFYRKVGDSIEIKGTYATGTTTASVLSIGLPSGLSVDSSKNPSTTNTASHGVVYNTTHTTTGFASTNVGPYPVFSDTSVSSTVLYVADTNSGSRFNKANGSTLFTTGDRMRFEVKGLPISGFSSSVQMSSDADTRVVDFVGYKAANEAVTANVTNVAYSSSKDSHGTWNGTQYNIPVTGDYNVTVGGSSSAGASINIYVNGSLVKELYTMNASTNTSASTVIPNLKTGDLLSIRSGASVTLNGAAASTNPNSLTISRISGPVTIAATERISCRYTSTAGGSIGTSATQQSFATKTFDTHGSWNGNTFTVQSSGEYEVSAALLTADVTLTTGQATSLLLYKNGSSYSILDRRIGNGTLGNITLTGTDSIECVSGDTISIYALSQVATSQNTASGYNYVSIKRVK